MFFNLSVFLKYLKGKNNKKGIAMTMFLLLLPLILAFFAFAVDVSILLHEQYRLELATRHAAYSASSSMIYMRDETNFVDQARAEDDARRVFEANFGVGTNPGVSIGQLPPHNTYIEVTATIHVPQYFIPVIVNSNNTVEVTRSHRVIIFGL